MVAKAATKAAKERLAREDWSGALSAATLGLDGGASGKAAVSLHVFAGFASARLGQVRDWEGL
jgi:hypothetical protein